MKRLFYSFALAVAAAAPAQAQTIQLPSFHSFSVDTTVVVPDSGSAHLGGTKRARAARDRFGPGVPQRTVGVERQASGAAALAKIHDPREREAALRREAQARGVKKEAVAPPVDRRTAALDPPVSSIAEIKARREEEAAQRQREARTLVAKGRVAESGGKPTVARIYYRQAARLARGALKRQISADLERLPLGTFRAAARPALSSE
jgi:hypothetical protein